MGVPELLLYTPLIAALVWAAVEDVRTRRIRNALAFPLLFAGIAQSFLPFHTTTPMMALGGFAVGFALIAVQFSLRGIGGGDLKLLAAIGTWVGPWGALNVFLAASVFGMIAVLFQACWQGRLAVLFKNSASLAVNIAHINQLGADHVADMGQRSQSIDKPIPYAVSLIVGVAAVLCGLGVRL